jgi:hypothetical protein
MDEFGSTASLVPSNNATVYLVLDDFGKLGRAYRETDEGRANLDTVVQDFLNGEFNRPVRVVAFNIVEVGLATLLKIFRGS